ncbi:segregation/condensation protein A [bacterium]|nr:segregation/condensation protein A [bacterium]PIV81440.1 MAG: segregation/condensation protein A [bacterium CG17_big_fil_post_rev_8_21_14_2_50_64_8]PJA75479.1 MAG: segregation/condensation protein A [bacterium CG_4_9_14_3_um_filter_65_15]
MIEPAGITGAREDTGSAMEASGSWSLDNLPADLEYFRTSQAYQVELSDFFQGPLDLLLHLIQKEQVDIYDIPIARITDQFIRHIEVIKSVSLDQAGDFLTMAATLLVIKMKMLMPSRLGGEDVEEEDPRAELVRRLLEYKRFKEVAETFQEQENQRRRFHLRGTKFPFSEELDLEPKLRIEMYDLLAAVAGIFERIQSTPGHAVVREPFTVGEKIELIRARLEQGGLVAFEDLFAEDSIKMEVIVTFIAVLEMAKLGRINFLQTEPHGPIWIQLPSEERVAAESVARESQA